jgi:ABC-2 type transport system permease protein
VALALHQFRYDQRIFWRNPASVFFTVLLPVIFLFLLASIAGDETLDERNHLDLSTYFVAGIMTLALVSATTTNLAMNLTRAREAGRLKRVRGTPLPAWAFVAGRVGNAIVVSLLMVVLLTLIGQVLYGVEVPTGTLAALLLSLVVGAFAFCCLGFALTAAIPSEDAAAPVTNGVLLPLYFLSGVFIPETEIPNGVLDVANVFPIRHLFEAFLTAFDPATSGAGFELGHLALIGAWGLAGLAIAIRSFRWAPQER